MLTMVEVRTDTGMLLQLPLADISGGYALQDVTGLDPVKATLVSSAFAQLDGSQFHSSRRESRNIVLTISYEPDYVNSDVRSLRQGLYGFFMTESKVNLRFIDTDGMTVDISGRVESFDSPQFTETPMATISIMCFNPDFYDPTPVTISGSTVADATNTAVEYAGEVESGITLTLNVDRSLSEFTVYSYGEDNVIRSMVFTADLIAGDVVTIVTTPGAKSVTLTRSGTTASALYSVSPYSSWIYFYPGTNQFRVYAEGAAIPYTVVYTTKYGGL